MRADVLYLGGKEGGDFQFYKVRVNWVKTCATLMFCLTNFRSYLLTAVLLLGRSNTPVSSSELTFEGSLAKEIERC